MATYGRLENAPHYHLEGLTNPDRFASTIKNHTVEYREQLSPMTQASFIMVRMRNVVSTDVSDDVNGIVAPELSLFRRKAP